VARKWVVLFGVVKSFLKPFLKKGFQPIILAVLIFSLIVSFGEKSPLLANQYTAKETEAAALIKDGKMLLEKGQPESALAIWEAAEKIYRKIGHYEGIIGSKLNQGHALEAMGFTKDSCDIILTTFPGLEVDKCDGLNDDNIKGIIDAIISQPSPFNWMGLESLGNRLRFLGKLEKSEIVLNESLTVNNSPQAQSKLLLALGNTKLKLGDVDDALKLYDMAANIEDALLETRLQALLNQLSLLIEEEWEGAEFLLAKIRPLIADLPVSKFSLEAKINLAGSLLKFDVQNLAEPLNYLELALAEAETIENKRLKSLALGKLGNFYEQFGDAETAKDYTKKALNLAQSIQAAEQAYQWQWQWGRLLEKEGDLEGAIAAYTASVNTLQTLRGSLTILNRDLQFDFREGVEPVYRKLVELLLVNPVEENLILARDVIELLQLAELDNFFQEACARVNNVNLDKIDTNAAVISTIFLPNRSQPKSLEVILSLPNKTVFHYSAPRPSQGWSYNDFLEALTTDLGRKPTQQNPNTLPANDLPKFQEIYDWLIEPMEEKLTANNIETLVFVLDGLLQNLPMAALHDGEKYLIEKYAIAVTPGLQLLASRNLKTEQIRVLAVGRSEFQNDELFSEWNDLDNVKDELAKIAEVVPAKQLLNQQFTTTNLREEINSLAFPLVHIATHAKFDSTAENTFIIVWGERIEIDRLGQLLRVKDPTREKDIDLLVLSACQTAQGNERTALGMAGAAIRVGARSTLASLWSVNDRSTAELMAQFYQKLQTSTNASNQVNKAEALRQAQITMLKGQFGERFQNPHFWAPFILVGHWL